MNKSVLSGIELLTNHCHFTVQELEEVIPASHVQHTAIMVHHKLWRQKPVFSCCQVLVEAFATVCFQFINTVEPSHIEHSRVTRVHYIQMFIKANQVKGK